MPIAAACSCGKSYQVDESLAGKRVKCKACGGTLVVPQKQAARSPAADEDDFRLAPLEPPPAAAAPVAARSDAAALAAPAASVAEAPAPATDSLPFFLAVSQGWSRSLVYRVYPAGDALLLLDVCPYNAMVNLEMARNPGGSHWGVKAVESLKTWVLGSAAVVGSIVGILGLAIARAGFDKPNQALQLVSFLFTVVAICIPVVILVVTWTMRVLVVRSRQLDGLDAAGVREECAKGGDRYRLAPGELSNVRIAPPKSSGPAITHRAEATFKHPSGSWRLLLFAPQDVKLAVASFRRIMSGDVEIDPSLERL
jgi:hypothetical protein